MLFTHEPESRMACNFNYPFENNDFSRSQPVTFTVSSVISWKRCQRASLLLQTTNRKWCLAYRTKAILVTVSHSLLATCTSL